MTTISHAERARRFLAARGQLIAGGEESEESPPADGDTLAETVANARALAADERAAWQDEVVAMLRWAEAGHEPDLHLAHDLAALRRLVPPGVCLDCGGPCPAGEQHWCAGCRAEGRKRP